MTDFGQGMLAEAVETRKKLEGPALVRTVGAAAAAALIGVTIWSLFPFSFRPATLILQIYEVVFGLAIIIVEMKDIEKFDKLRQFFYKWFPFLTVTWGKGLFYIFTGSLGGTFYSNLILFVPAMVVVAVGGIYLSVYFSKKKDTDEGFDQTFATTAYIPAV